MLCCVVAAAVVVVFLGRVDADAPRVLCHAPCADSTQQALEADQVDAEAKLAKVKKAKEAAAAAFSSMKASGLGGVELNRDMYIKLEEEIAETKAQLKVPGVGAGLLRAVCLCPPLVPCAGVRS